jgi:hypothetical protein
MTEKTYEDGIREERMRHIEHRQDELEVLVKEGFKTQWHELDAVKKSLWMLFGGLVVVGVVFPLMWRWAFS